MLVPLLLVMVPELLVLPFLAGVKAEDLLALSRRLVKLEVEPLLLPSMLSVAGEGAGGRGGRGGGLGLGGGLA